MFNNFGAYQTNNQYGNQDSDRIIKKQNKNIWKLLRQRYKLRTENQTLKTEVDRLRRKNDMLTVENCQLKQFAFPLMQQNQNQQASYSGRNPSLNLSNVECPSHVQPSRVFGDNLNNQSITEQTALKVTSPAFIPKGDSQTHSSHNQHQNANDHINISTLKANYKNKIDDKVLNPLNNLGNDESVKNINTLQKTTDNYGLYVGKKTKSWFNIESLRTELEQAKDMISENPRSLSEKLKDIKASSQQKINKVPNMTSEQEKF